MPAAQLASAAIEKILNHLLKLDENARRQLQSLQSKRLKVTVKELPWPLVFHFSDHIDVLVEQQESIESDCHLGVSLSTIDKLRDTSQITRLIKQNELTLDGDIHVAQGFSQLLQNIDIDWEEQLSRYSGDVVAHQIFQHTKRLFHGISRHFNNSAQAVSEALIEEKKWMAHGIMVEDFCAQVDQLRSDSERLAARLALLENRHKQDEA